MKRVLLVRERHKNSEKEFDLTFRTQLFQIVPYGAESHLQSPLWCSFCGAKKVFLSVSSDGYHYNSDCRRSPRMETLKGLCVGFHALFGRRSLGLRILITVVTISVCSSAWADTEAHRQAAEQVLKLTNTHRMLEPMIRQMQQRQLKQLEEMNLPNEADAITGKYILRMNELLKAELAWDKMKDEYINLYASVFSEKELGELIQFFRSSIGQKMVEKNPDIMYEVMLLGQNRLMKIMPQMQVISDEMVRELREHVHQ